MLEYAAVYFPKNILNYVNVLKIYYEQKIFKTGADELEGDSVSEKGGGGYNFITPRDPKRW